MSHKSLNPINPLINRVLTLSADSVKKPELLYLAAIIETGSSIVFRFSKHVKSVRKLQLQILCLSSTGLHLKHSIQDALYMKIIMDKLLLKTPCMTQMQSLRKGKRYGLTPTWTLFAQWYNAVMISLQSLETDTQHSAHSSPIKKKKKIKKKLKHTFQDILGHLFLRMIDKNGLWLFCFDFVFHKLYQNSSSCIPWRVLRKFAALHECYSQFICFFKKGGYSKR